MTIRRYPTTRLFAVLALDRDAVPVNPSSMYDFAGVYSFARGLFERGPVNGSETTYRVFHRLHTDQFVMSQPKGWEGALARVTEPFDGKFLSPVYQTFSVNPDRLNIQYLEYFFKQRWTWAALERMSKGMGARRNAVYPDMLLSMEIPLPVLDVQRRIVAVIERLAAKIEEARGLQIQVAEGWENLCRGLLLSSEGKLTPMREIVDQREPDVTVARHEAYDFAGVYCFGGGVFKGQRKSGMKIGYSRLTRLRAGDFVYPKLMAWEGALSVVPVACDGLVVSPEFPVFEIRQNLVLPEVLDVYFRTPSVWPLLGAISTGTNVRRRRLHPDRFLAFEMPLPPRERQYQLRGLKTKVDLMKALQAQAAAELDALLPAVLDRAFQGEL